MNNFKIALTVTLLSLGFSTLAAAGGGVGEVFSPKSAAFTAMGSFGLTQNGVTDSCAAHLRGSTDPKGHAKLTAARFTGSTACAAIQRWGMPWRGKPDSSDTAVISGVSLSGPTGLCGPGSVLVAVNDSGTWTIAGNDVLPGGCTVTGTLQTTPAITIVPKD